MEKVEERRIKGDTENRVMSSEEEKKKRAIFEGMSPRRQQKILKKGYEKWNPFLEPKEPPFYRKGERSRGQEAAELFVQFLQHKQAGSESPESLSPGYVQGAREICLGLIRDRDERCQGMVDFCKWFSRFSEEEQG